MTNQTMLVFAVQKDTVKPSTTQKHIIIL